MIGFIDDHRGAYGVEPICKLLPIAPSTYHAHAARRTDPARLPARAGRDVVLATDIQRVFDANFGVYGVRKVWRQLGREGKKVARCTVARLMRRMGLQGVVRGREVRTTVSNPAVVCPLDRVNRQFHAPRPNALWLSDFTYVATWQGFVYVAFVIDAFARRIVGWRVSRTAHASFVLDALEQALHERRPVQGSGLVHHSPGSPVRLDPLHRAPRRCGHRALGRQRRRQLRQRLGRDDQRPLQDRGHPAQGTLALAGDG
jgi:transposase InsO family protein